MNRSAMALRKATFALVTAVALGFGATQALATPSSAAARLCTAQEDQRCAEYCRSIRADTGYCDPLAAGRCRCVFY